MLTKLAMAKVIVTATYNMKELVKETDWQYRDVSREMKNKKEFVIERYNLAHAILTKRVREECVNENPEIYK